MATENTAELCYTSKCLCVQNEDCFYTIASCNMSCSRSSGRKVTRYLTCNITLRRSQFTWKFIYLYICERARDSFNFLHVISKYRAGGKIGNRNLTSKLNFARPKQISVVWLGTNNYWCTRSFNLISVYRPSLGTSRKKLFLWRGKTEAIAWKDI